jgi:uncharacterized protein (TIGR03000 family)
MIRPMRPPVWAEAFATAALLLAVRPAGAQNTPGYYYETYRYGYDPGYYARRVAIPGPSVMMTKTSPGGVAPGARVRYAPVASAKSSARGNYLAVALAASAGTDIVARVELRVPDGADVWFGEPRTKQVGTQRQFESPPLAPAKEYVYQIRLVWMADGHETAESRNVSVRAGDRLTESFPAAAGQE